MDDHLGAVGREALPGGQAERSLQGDVCLQVLDRATPAARQVVMLRRLGVIEGAPSPSGDTAHQPRLTEGLESGVEGGQGHVRELLAGSRQCRFVIESWRGASDRERLLKVIQPGLIGLIDGTVSAPAPTFAVAYLAGSRAALLVGLAAALGAAISMGLSEALSDDGSLTGRGTRRSGAGLPASRPSSVGPPMRCRS